MEGGGGGAAARLEGGDVLAGGEAGVLQLHLLAVDSGTHWVPCKGTGAAVGCSGPARHKDKGAEVMKKVGALARVGSVQAAEPACLWVPDVHERTRHGLHWHLPSEGARGEEEPAHEGHNGGRFHRESLQRD